MSPGHTANKKDHFIVYLMKLLDNIKYFKKNTWGKEVINRHEKSLLSVDGMVILTWSFEGNHEDDAESKAC